MSKDKAIKILRPEWIPEKSRWYLNGSQNFWLNPNGWCSVEGLLSYEERDALNYITDHPMEFR